MNKSQIRATAGLVLSVVCSVCAAILPTLEQLPAKYQNIALIVSTVGAIAGAVLAALNQSLSPNHISIPVNPSRKRKNPAPFVSLLLVSSLLASTSACGNALEWTKKASIEIKSAHISAAIVVDEFVRAGKLTFEQGVEQKWKLASLYSAYSTFDAALQSQAKLDASAALALLPLARDYMRQLEAANIINLPHPEASERFREIVFVLRIVANRIVSRLESRSRSAAPQSVSTLRRERREFERDLSRLKTLTSVTNHEG